MRMGGVSQKAHRLAWHFDRGAIPEGAMVLHTCDNRGCVNPDHLYLGDHSQNMSDRNGRDRLIHGERHPSAKLTEGDVRTIRELAGSRSWGSLARQFAVTPAAVRFAATGKTWRRTA